MDPPCAAVSSTTAIATTALTTAAVLAVLRHVLFPPRQKILPSPLHTVLPALSADAVAQLPYKPDAFPGARDVETPYGSIRVYEFGPATGRKVLLLHGISTSCMTLGPLARGLVEHAGCRVMLFDLFGRGFSDGVGDLPHDARLYTTQMLLALASSPLAWTGRRSFDLLGYSMGGGIAVHFAAAFPHLLRSFVLLAPAGLIRPQRFGVAPRLVFRSGVVPPLLLAAVTRRRLRQPIASGKKAKAAASAVQVAVTKAAKQATEENAAPGAAEAAGAVADTKTNGAAAAAMPPMPAPTPERVGRVLCMQVMQYVRWMLVHHAGFVPAFMGCIRDAPLIGQQATWQAVARLVLDGVADNDAVDADTADTVARTPLPLCVVFGNHDDVVDVHDYEADVLPLFQRANTGHDAAATAAKPTRPANLTWETVPGGHEFPMTFSRPVMRIIFKFWGAMDKALASVDAADEAEACEIKEEEEEKAAGAASKAHNANGAAAVSAKENGTNGHLKQ